MKLINFFKLILVIFLNIGVVCAQEEVKGEGLENKIQNPVADLINVPFQNNTDIRDGDVIRNTLNIQPVVPVKLTENLNMVTRVVLPVVSLKGITDEYEHGLGNTVVSAFFTSSKPSKFMWGIGPAFMLPATDINFGYRRLGLAPVGVALYQDGGWTFGALVQNFFGIAGPKDGHELNLFYAQVFVVKNLSNGWYINTAPIITADWERIDQTGGWVIPVGMGVGKLFRIGKLPINAQVAFYKNVYKEDYDGYIDWWQLRAQVAFILPNF